MNKQIKIKSICLDPKCSGCNKSAAKIEIVEPNAYPNEAINWNADDFTRYQKFRDFQSNYLIYSGPGGSNGAIGDSIDLKRKLDLIEVFTEPYHPIKIREQFYDMAGYCVGCGKFYCSKHWRSSAFGYGRCPEGHGKSLDPHWSPDIE